MRKKYNKDVHFVCKLTGIKSIEKIYGKLANYDVVLTDERKEHILDRRNKDGIEVLMNVKETIEKYDYIIDAQDNCLRYVKLNQEKNYAYVIKLSIKDRTKANSIISGIIINKRKVSKYVKNNMIIDKR